MIRTTGEENAVTTYAYDTNNQVTAVTDAAGTIGYTYDTLGQLTAETDRAGASTHYERDSLAA